MTPIPTPAPPPAYRYPGYLRLTGNPGLDDLLTLWRRRQNWHEQRPPRWSELRDDLYDGICLRMALVLHREGMRPPVCLEIFPVAAGILGLPWDFRGTRWPDPPQLRALAGLARRAARSRQAATGRLPLDARSPPGVADHILAAAVPLALEADHASPAAGRCCWRWHGRRGHESNS
ncbi:hypothetical protein JL100_004055 [Skermanella mucosa]|uniref:hypothetical protein n=1 Tax=Skermanella mucosa TaxID=1789672 RepID=UPI00192CBDBE|nr:hypothetical protein [Skermanella mucosa]UEM21948.1 hypothetical protein JL100_004055 [Skermanella mucosa]